MSEPALRAPDYIKTAAAFIAEYGWCGSNADPIGQDAPPGLTLTRAVLWAVGGQGYLARDLSDIQSDQVSEVLDHLEAPMGLGMTITAYEQEFAGVSARNVAFELLVAAVRYEGSLVVVT